jgi:hypothetical protein
MSYYSLKHNYYSNLHSFWGFIDSLSVFMNLGSRQNHIWETWPRCMMTAVTFVITGMMIFAIYANWTYFNKHYVKITSDWNHWVNLNQTWPESLYYYDMYFQKLYLMTLPTDQHCCCYYKVDHWIKFWR